MPRSICNPPIADEAPKSAVLTTYDREHVSVYVRLLDAEADGADWMEASVTILHIDPIREPMRAYRAWETHLSRAKWMAENGYQQLVRPVH
jgi:hypothetical protein